MSTCHIERSDRLKGSWSIYEFERSERLNRSWSTYHPFALILLNSFWTFTNFLWHLASLKVVFTWSYFIGDSLTKSLTNPLTISCVWNKCFSQQFSSFCWHFQVMKQILGLWLYSEDVLETFEKAENWDKCDTPVRANSTWKFVLFSDHIFRSISFSSVENVN